MGIAVWDERYSEAELVYGAEPNDFLVSVADRLPPGRALCLAEGQGRNAVWLAGRGYRVLGVDLSPVGLARAQELAASRGVTIETQVADLATFDLGVETFDFIVSIWAHTPVAVRAPLHARCVAALKPGGAFVLEAYTPAQVGRGTGGPPVAELMVTAEALSRELGGLRFEILRELEREVKEGRYHAGLSAVVQALAFKPA